MKNAAQTATEDLVSFCVNLTDEQAEKLVQSLDLLEQLARMTEYELVFSETFLKRFFGKGGVA